MQLGDQDEMDKTFSADSAAYHHDWRRLAHGFRLSEI